MILVTGSSGFVGKNLTKALLCASYSVKGVARAQKESLTESKFEFFPIDDFSEMLNWQDALEGISAIVHTIARVHVMDDRESNPIEAFRRVNVQATLNLARQAAASGVKRFIFISSIKVNGEGTTAGRPFLETDNTIPTDPYGLSKYEAEKGLLEIAHKTGLEIVIIRPPLVYGPGVKANFASMLKWVKIGIPLPFGAVNNKRSLIALENLIDFIVTCIENPKAANEIFLISDGRPVSTTELLEKVAKAYGKNTILIPVSTKFMGMVATLVGKRAVAERLFGSLEVNCSKSRNVLNWQPVITIDEQLKKMAELF